MAASSPPGLLAAPKHLRGGAQAFIWPLCQENRLRGGGTWGVLVNKGRKLPLPLESHPHPQMRTGRRRTHAKRETRQVRIFK